MRRGEVACMMAVFLTACAGGGQGSTRSLDVTVPSAAPTTEQRVDESTTRQTTAVTTASQWTGLCGRQGPAPKAYDHVIWIWMENKDRNAVFDSARAPFLSGLADSCGTARDYVDHGVHPSLPNYIAATSGETQGIHDDAGPNAHRLEADNLFRQVREIDKVSKSYEEAMPANCALKSTGRYAVKHNPAAYYVGHDDRDACLRDDVGFDHFLTDLVGDLPAFSLITPDICNDMHDCSVATGDKWLANVVTAVTSSAVYREGRTAVFIVFDESEGGGTMPFFAVAPSIVPGTRAEVELDHYSLLGFTEDALGITTRLGKAAGAPSLADAFGI